MTGPAIASRVVGTIRMKAESHRGRVVRKNVMIALTKLRVSRSFSGCHRNVQLCLLGWLEGSTIAIEYPWSKGHDERLAEIAAELSAARSTLLSRGEPYPPLRQNRRRRCFRSSSRRWRTHLALASSPVWRGRVAIKAPPASERPLAIAPATVPSKAAPEAGASTLLTTTCSARSRTLLGGICPVCVSAVTLRARRPLRLRDRCPLEVNELPAPVLPNEHAGAATLLIHLPVLVLSLGGGTTGHDGGIAVDAHFGLVWHQRLEIHAPALAVLEVLRPILDHAARAVMDVVVVQDSLKEGDICLDDGLIEVLDDLGHLPVVSGRVAEWLSHSRLPVL